MMTRTGQEFRQGWRTVVAAGVGVCAGVTGLPFYSVGLFMKPLSAEYGWSRAGISGAALCLQAGIIVSAPLIGWLIDRAGTRQVALWSLLGLALAFCALPAVGPSLVMFYAAWLGLSLLGCGTTPVVWTRAVNERFSAARGLALGLTLLGTGAAGVIAPAVFAPIFANAGWRAGCLAIAAAIAFVALPIIFALFRARQPAGTAGAAASLGAGLTRPAAVRSRRFVQLATAFFLLGFAIAGLIVHLVPMLADRGMDAAQAARTAASLGLAVIVGRVVVGALVDRYHAPYVAFAFLLLPVASCLLLLGGFSPLLAVLLLGLAAGAEIDLLAYLVARYFGMRAFGEIYGWALSIFSLGAGLGPVVCGAAYDWQGSYDLALAGGAAIVLAGASLIAALGAFPDYDPQSARVAR